MTQPDETVTGPPDDYADQLKQAVHEVLSITPFECIASQCGTSSTGDCGCAAKLRAQVERLTDACKVSQRAMLTAQQAMLAAQAEVERLTASIRAIGRRSAPSTRTWDGMIADMGWINDETRTALESKP